MTALCCPIEPHELTKDMRRGMDSIVQRVAAASAVSGSGVDLLLRIYLAGVYHGQALARIDARRGETREAGLDPEGTKAGIAPNP